MRGSVFIATYLCMYVLRLLLGAVQLHLILAHCYLLLAIRHYLLYARAHKVTSHSELDTICSQVRLLHFAASPYMALGTLQ